MIREPLLYDLFEETRTIQKLNGPGLEEYYLFLDLLESKNYPLKSFNDLAFVLETIWLKSYQQRDQFREILEQRRTALLHLSDKVQDQFSGVSETKKESDTGKSNSSKHDGINEISDQPPKNGIGDEQKDDKKINRKNDDKDNSTSVTNPENEKFGDTGFSMNKEQLTKGKVLNLDSVKEKEVPLLSIPYIFSNDYLPVKGRHLQQAWRQLKNKQDGNDSSEINITETIKSVTDKGYFSNFKFDKEKTNQLNLFVFLDQSETMIASEEFGEELVKSAKDSNIHSDAKPWFFYKVPQKNATDEYYFTNKDGTDSITLTKMFSRLNKKDIVVMIYSDAGTLKNDWDVERIEQTSEFVNFLYKTTSYVVWVNPAPQDRWPGTNSIAIYSLTNIPMYESNRNGIENAIAGLKGKISILPTLIKKSAAI